MHESSYGQSEQILKTKWTPKTKWLPKNKMAAIRRQLLVQKRKKYKRAKNALSRQLLVLHTCLKNYAMLFWSWDLLKTIVPVFIPLSKTYLAIPDSVTPFQNIDTLGRVSARKLLIVTSVTLFIFIRSISMAAEHFTATRLYTTVYAVCA